MNSPFFALAQGFDFFRGMARAFEKKSARIAAETRVESRSFIMRSDRRVFGAVRDVLKITNMFIKGRKDHLFTYNTPSKGASAFRSSPYSHPERWLAAQN